MTSASRRRRRTSHHKQQEEEENNPSNDDDHHHNTPSHANNQHHNAGLEIDRSALIEYQRQCSLYELPSHPNILITLRYELNTFHPYDNLSLPFNDVHLLPLAELLQNTSIHLSYLTCIDLSNCYHQISHQGIAVISYALRYNHYIKKLILNRTRVGAAGAQVHS